MTIDLLSRLQALGLLGSVIGIYHPSDRGAPPANHLDVPLCDISKLESVDVDAIVIASDEEKEDLLIRTARHVRGAPRVLLAGYGHLAYRNAMYNALQQELHVPSLANGYPNSLIHIFQCLENAARLELHGVVVEFGMFKGGTTMFIARAVRSLNAEWRVIGFDTFSGFPPRRSVLDMYDHPDCVYHDKSAVERYLSGWNVEIVEGDIVETCSRLDREDVVLAFVDTDNFTPASAAIDVLRERVVVGGAIVLDHFTGVDRFAYTLGERIAARVLLEDPAFFNLHGTGVFLRQDVSKG